MRWVDRGPEPGGVAGYARQFTQGWVNYFQNPVGGRPDDSYWREFRPILGSWTNNNCWYCERQCQPVGGWAPTVDHFQPISRFPLLAYAWSNWVFSCQRCNDLKGNKWPQSGYVDPCAADIMERPERYFDYDVDAGEIIPKNGLTGDARQKALHTIDDLGLSIRDLVNPRFTSIRQFIEEFTEELLELPTADREAFIEDFLALTTAGRLAFLVFSASSKGQTIEYTGVKGMVAERLLRDGHI